MLLRCNDEGVPADAQRALRRRRGRLCATAGLALNTLAYATGRFAPAGTSGLGDFLAGLFCGLAITLLVASAVLVRPWASSQP